MKVRNYFDRQLADFFKVLYHKIYWLTGKDNFWIASALALSSALIAFGSNISFLATPSLRSEGEMLAFFHGAGVGGIFWFGLVNMYAASVLRQNARRNDSREIRVVDPEAEACKIMYQRIRMLFLLIWPAAIASIVYFANPVAKEVVLIFGSMAVAYVLGGAAMYFVTIEEPPKGRLRIKGLVKSLLSRFAPKGRLIPIPAQ